MNFDPDIGIKILVVDDNPLGLWTTRRCLEEMDCYVTETTTGAAAEDMCKSSRFDLIIADYRLSDAYGTDIIKAVREAGYNGYAVSITGESEFISEDARKELGIYSVLNKPLDIEELKKTVFNISDLCKDSAENKKGAKIKKPDQVGRFLLIQAPENITLKFLLEINRIYSSKEWIALDMTQTKTIDKQAYEMLFNVADAHSRKGAGRFCLAGLSEKLWSDLEQQRADRKVDMLKDIESLDALSRKLTSTAERKTLLDSVIFRL
jgi:CheY-like chemotaxis protein